MSSLKTVILHVILYGHETCSPTSREEQRLRVLENRVMRIFGPKRQEVAGGCRTLHGEKLHNLYASSSITRVIDSKRMRWAENVARMGEMSNA
jgi:hypothetical protein